MIKDDVSVIEPTFNTLKKNFQSGVTRDLEFRKKQLQALIQGLQDLEQDIVEALDSDLGYKSKGVVNLFAIGPVVQGIKHSIAHLKSNAKIQKVKTNVLVGNGQSYVVPEPFGVSLVIGSWNYPLFTALAPATEAISAGNCVVMKPSELAPKMSNVLKKLFEKYLDSRFYRVIEGAVQVAIKITTFKWDLIIFTGSPQKGKLVAKAAAENLVPCILELGGKSPTIIDEDADLDNACKRIATGKFGNAGQTCIAPDFILISEKIKDVFIKHLSKTIVDFYGIDAQKSKDYSRVVTEFHTERLVKMIQEQKEKVVYGGNSDVKDLYIEPTLVLNPDKSSQIMEEEIFGPILPIITYKDFQTDVVDYINNGEKPLALYYFGQNKQHKQLLENTTSSGAFVTNECLMHVLNYELPFGGVGNSGMSTLHGKWGFFACSHLKPVLHKDTYNGWPMHIRYPPYTDSKISLTKRLMAFGSFQNEDIKAGLGILILLIIFVYFVLPRFLGNDSQDL